MFILFLEAKTCHTTRSCRTHHTVTPHTAPRLCLIRIRILTTDGCHLFHPFRFLGFARCRCLAHCVATLTKYFHLLLHVFAISFMVVFVLEFIAKSSTVCHSMLGLCSFTRMLLLLHLRPHAVATDEAAYNQAFFLSSTTTSITSILSPISNVAKSKKGRCGKTS